VGDITKEALGEVGSGGGHSTMAGGSIPLRMGVDLDVEAWVQEDLFPAFLDASGQG
jgi:nanoRNase/pAp phosphatase (c-di-AMP/oligoRNAs hydrolase)